MGLSFPGAATRLGLSGRRLVVAIVFLGYFSLGAAWALAGPYGAAQDELAHIIRAAGVVNGQIAPTPANAAWHTGAFQTVPKSLVRPECWQPDVTISAACDRASHADQTPVRVPTTAGRYNPVFYAIVGLPLRFWPTMKGVMLGRLIDAALVAGLLALAASAAMSWSRRRAGLAGVVLLSTPTLMSVTGAINPSGIEIAAGILLFTALIPLTDPEVRAEPRMVHYVGISALILLTVRAAGPLWLAAAGFALLIPNRWAHIKALLKTKPVRVWLAVLIVVGLAGVGWTVGMRTLDLMRIDTPNPPFTLTQSLEFVVLNEWGTYLIQMVSLVGWLVPVPSLVFVLWAIALGGMVVPAVVAGGRRDRYRILVIIVMTWLVPTITDPFNSNVHGFPTQGRYLMPLFAGAVLLSAEVLARRGVWDGPRARAFVLLTALFFMPVIHLVTFATAMARWQSGVSTDFHRPHVNPLNGDWHPAVGSVLPLVAAFIGVALVAVACWMATARVTEPRANEALSVAEEDALTPAGLR